MQIHPQEAARSGRTHQSLVRSLQRMRDVLMRNPREAQLQQQQQWQQRWQQQQQQWQQQQWQEQQQQQQVQYLMGPDGEVIYPAKFQEGGGPPRMYGVGTPPMLMGAGQYGAGACVRMGGADAQWVRPVWRLCVCVRVCRGGAAERERGDWV